MSEKFMTRSKCVWPMVALPLLYTLLFSLFTSCSGEQQNFLMEGDFKGFNQGELYIYGYDGTHRLDTVAVVKGHFRYEVPLEDTTLFVMVFPNYSELAVLGINGSTVKVAGDASHLRETSIKGIKENEDMTAFRKKTSQETPPELAKSVVQFVHEHPASPFASYLIRKHFVQTLQPDYQQAMELTKAVQKARPEMPQTKGLIRRMEGLKTLKDGNRLPTFTATDINGVTVKSAELDAKVNVISVWANWNYESIGLQRKLLAAYEKNKDDMKVVSICLDADVKGCRRRVERDSVKWSTICDGKAWDTPVIQTLGLSFVPDNILIDGQGKIVAHTLTTKELMAKIEAMLPKSP